ncbi:hypothetical protein JVU11DRAFT_5254 [Chiua virens]|nr:hypothetical protein JVU11DRAFT_5254 [Chiua virens]
MLRGVGRIHSQYNANHALRVPTLPPVLHGLHSSCTSSALHALALSTNHTRQIPQGTPRVHVPPTCPGTSPLFPPISSSRPPSVHPGHFPSGILNIIDTFSSGTNQQVATIISEINASFKLRRYIRQRESARRLAQFLASTSRPTRALSLMTLAHALGCRFKPNHFESVLHQLSLKQRWSLIPPLVSLARDQCGKTTARLLNWKLRAFIECHRFNRLDHVLEEFARDNVLPTQRTFHLLVSGHLRNQDLDSAKRNLQSMERAGFPVDPSTHALIVTAYRSLGLDTQVHARAFAALRHVDAQTSTRIFNSIIQHFLDVGDESTAVAHINRMLSPGPSNKEAPCQPGDATTGADGVVSPLIDPFPRSSENTPVIHADAATFTILINYLNNQRQFHRVHNVLNCMVEFDVKPDSGVVAALIRTYCLSGRDDMAMGMLAAASESDADSRSILAFLRLKVIPQLPLDVNGIGLTTHILNAALPRIMEIHGLGGARFIFRIMRSRGIQVNAATIEVFLNYLDRLEHIETSQMSQVLRTISRKIHGPTIRHLNIVLRNALRRENHRIFGTGWDTTAAKFSPTRRHKPPENSRVFKFEDFDPDGSHLDLMRNHPCIRSTIFALARKGVKSDRATFAMWLKHEGTTDPTLGTAKSVFRHMVDRGMHPNRHHFISLMDGFIRAGDTQAAELVMRSAEAAGFKPDVVMWTVLISGYGRKGEPALAMKTFRMMVAAGIPPDVPAIDALAHAYFAVGAYSAAKKILIELWPQVKPFPSELKNAPLKQLARAFRQPEDLRVAWKEPLSPQERRSFHQKLRQALQEWKQI